MSPRLSCSFSWLIRPDSMRARSRSSEDRLTRLLTFSDARPRISCCLGVTSPARPSRIILHLGQDRIQRTPNFVGDHGDEFRLDLVQALQGSDVVQYGDGAHVPAGPVDVRDAAGLQDRTRLTGLGLAANLFGQFHEIVSGYGQRPVDQLFNLGVRDDFTRLYALRPGPPGIPSSSGRPGWRARRAFGYPWP